MKTKSLLIILTILMIVMTSVAQVTSTFNDSINKKTYKTVKIGTQTWMAENLANKPASGSFWVYDNNQGNEAIYGFLYDWETAKNVCPSGWHLPGDEEWKTLMTFLGGKGVAGGKLKETGLTHWVKPNTDASNSSGFSALPGGGRDANGRYNNIGGYGMWWSSSGARPGCARLWYMAYRYSDAGRGQTVKTNSLSVRCIKN